MTGYRARAACRDHDPEWWFAGQHDAADRDKALTVCEGCPVRMPCLLDSFTPLVEGGQVSGIWGGTTDRERRMFRAAAGATGGRAGRVALDLAPDTLAAFLAEVDRDRCERHERKQRRERGRLRREQQRQQQPATPSDDPARRDPTEKDAA